MTKWAHTQIGLAGSFFSSNKRFNVVSFRLLLVGFKYFCAVRSEWPQWKCVLLLLHICNSNRETSPSHPSLPRSFHTVNFWNQISNRFSLVCITLHFQIVADGELATNFCLEWKIFSYLQRYKLNIILFIGHMCIIYLITPRIPHEVLTPCSYRPCASHNFFSSDARIHFDAIFRLNASHMHNHTNFAKYFRIIVLHALTRFDGFNSTTSMNVCGLNLTEISTGKINSEKTSVRFQESGKFAQHNLRANESFRSNEIYCFKRALGI